ncbi:alpha/beta hydrolase [Bacillus sp. CECT 9360]|uniref:alpha/beta hydrolase n=1 Tax=Bacillus sp. CECT 9360 TaxID=2845821 RepID=UPI001E42F8C0|nr:alpha/beta hydrolase [Bacillus sp. CECT 9360]CAH0345771.1 Monoterpene epsilon-lactone hydrolase [Bacillus sp. CECT 9360]
MASKESLAERNRLIEYVASQPKKLTIQESRNRLEALLASIPIDPDIKTEKIMIENTPAEWVIAPNAARDRVFLYLHGGAYMLGSLNTHRDLAAKLSRSTATRVLVIEYRLAPEHPFPSGIEDAVTAYRWLLRSGISPERIVVGGDSAGGGLTMAMLLSLRDAGDALPASAILLSPWTDMEGTGESMESRADADPWLNPEQNRAAPFLYIGSMDRRHPLVSPIYADLQGLPPMLVHVGNDEILLDDSVRLVERANAAGVEATLKVWEDMWHVFQQFTTPEASKAIDEIGEYVKQKLENETQKISTE